MIVTVPSTTLLIELDSETSPTELQAAEVTKASDAEVSKASDAKLAKASGTKAAKVSTVHVKVTTVPTPSTKRKATGDTPPQPNDPKKGLHAERGKGVQLSSHISFFLTVHGRDEQGLPRLRGDV